MKELLQQLAACNIWANQRLLDCILLLPEEVQRKEMHSSFPSLHKTLMHMWDAESIWWQRMKMQEVITAPALNFTGTTQDVANALLQQNKMWEAWISNATPAALDHVFHYRNSKKKQFRQPVYQMLLHLFNHGTYHRGQLVSLLRQAGVDKISATDFIVWSRGK